MFKGYEIIEHRFITDLNSDGYLLKHTKTGANVTLLLNDDDNKVFYIGFKTPPKDSTGVAHILEHSVLCGSKKYPVKDPFVELAKGSLNTFLNAMTYPDKTVYPVASCNDKDFKNLVDVYLDAVFNPNIYREEKIFMQEGWHYEYDDEKDELSLNGVVYNEMKGVYSSPDDVVEREVMNSLYPESTYGIESGGDPDFIPELTYEQFLDFHSKYYHPSNSFIYLYGNLDPDEYLEYLDREYLGKYEKITVESDIVSARAFEKPLRIDKEYSILEEDDNEGTYLTYNISAGTSLDKELYIALDVLDYVLCSAPGSMIKKALIEKGIGEDVYSSVETGIYEPYFSIIAKGCKEDQLDDFVNTVEEVLAKAAKELPEKALKAALNVFEFKYREADFGSYPRGLMLGLQALDSWLYDPSKPFIHIEENDTFAKLRENISKGYFESVVKEYFIDNRHKTIMKVSPKAGLTLLKEEALKKKLEALKASFSDKELKELAQKTAALKEYQESADSEEDLKKIPLLERDDLREDPVLPVNEEKTAGNIPVLFHDIFTNGISYSALLFDITDLPPEKYVYAGLLMSVLGMVDTKNYSYNDLFNEINIHTGGIRPSIVNYVDYKNDNRLRTYFVIRSKYLKNERSAAFDLVYEMIMGSDFSNTDRLLEILNENKMRLQSVMMSAGHSVAAARALGYFSKEGWINERIGGIELYRFICSLTDDFDDQKDGLSKELTKLRDHIFSPDRMMADFTGTKEDYEGFDELLTGLASKIPVSKRYEGSSDMIVLSKKNEGFKTSGQVQFVALAGSFKNKGLEYTGALRALKIMLGYDYLWNNVRVLGGAYGCMSSFRKNGECFFVSYRDPNLKNTLDIYREAADYVDCVSLDDRKILQFVIGALSELDTPMTPQTKGNYSLNAYISGLSDEDFIKERKELLNIDEDILRGLSKFIRAFVEDDNICVVGGAEAITSQSDLFKNIEQLL
ncbi:MAG: insulinase family protein [Lachnospiraceae bacterium]|nr:insulinase family protein [Lachnospiraceae bacterium]